MATRRKKAHPLLSETKTTAQAEVLSATKGASRKGRDQLTRITTPIKGVTTQSRQWNRYSP